MAMGILDVVAGSIRKASHADINDCEKRRANVASWGLPMALDRQPAFKEPDLSVHTVTG
jgi:hypothetical protein